MDCFSAHRMFLSIVLLDPRTLEATSNIHCHRHFSSLWAFLRNCWSIESSEEGPSITSQMPMTVCVRCPSLCTLIQQNDTGKHLVGQTSLHWIVDYQIILVYVESHHIQITSNVLFFWRVLSIKRCVHSIPYIKWTHGSGQETRKNVRKNRQHKQTHKQTHTRTAQENRIQTRMYIRVSYRRMGNFRGFRGCGRTAKLKFAKFNLRVKFLTRGNAIFTVITSNRKNKNREIFA